MLMTVKPTVKCHCCGTDVPIPDEVQEAASKWNARNEAQRKLMKDKRDEDPSYGKPEITKIEGGCLLHNNRAILTDDIMIFRKKSGWDGRANITWRMLNPELEQYMTDHQTDEYVIEVEKDGQKYQSRVRGKSFHGGGRCYRLEFEGVGTLNLGGA